MKYGEKIRVHCLCRELVTWFDRLSRPHWLMCYTKRLQPVLRALVRDNSLFPSIRTGSFCGGEKEGYDYNLDNKLVGRYLLRLFHMDFICARTWSFFISNKLVFYTHLFVFYTRYIYLYLYFRRMTATISTFCESNFCLLSVPSSVISDICGRPGWFSICAKR